MSTLVLQTAGAALGGLFGGPLGAMIGRAAGGIAGAVVDQALFGPGPRHVTGPRLKELHIQGSSEGSPVARVYGRNRIAGQLIWATRFEEVITTRKQKSGGKGSLTAPKSKVTEYSYYANFAIGLCEGEISSIGRVWADGKEIDISSFTWRLYKGDEDQLPDSLIVAKQPDGTAPAYRGLAYIVFEHMPLERFGNRLPQLSFEVFRPLDGVEQQITSVNIIPGGTEFGYDTDSVSRDNGWGETQPVNTHTLAGKPDWSVSMDQLQGACPAVSAASLVVSWFADDLRCGHTTIRPGVETSQKSTTPHTWQVAGVDRANARLLSQIDGKPAFGGTPSDGSVLRALADLKARGLETVFYPFIMMDIPDGNTLVDPYQGTAPQPVYPWRGAITCDPAPGQPASPDKTAAVSAQIDAFFGNAQISDFSVSGDQVLYSGPVEWGLRRMVLHYAHLCAIAGGVDAFLIGSELKNLTVLRDNTNTFPAVAALEALAGDVAQILPQAKISYAADWSEYFGYHPTDGSGDVYFHLDSLWMSPHVHFIGIDNYMPLSDWRHDPGHADETAGFTSVYDLDYLKGNIAGGEGFDWYYVSDQDRQIQKRTPIADDAHAAPWVFRYKDLKNWWGNLHYNRPGGVAQASPTPWLPQSKPFWFTETGCPALDNATNQPNVFFDPKSSDSAVPWFSTGERDDFVQRRYIAAILDHWQTPGDHNPVSALYSGTMVDASHIFLWAWDARPFPAFPYRDDVWSDGENYDKGHWINGRAGAITLASLIGQILQEYGFTGHDVSSLQGVVDGYVIDTTMSARQVIEPLAALFSFEAVESGKTLKFRHHNVPISEAIAVSDLVETNKDAPLFTLRRQQETDLPDRLQMLFLDPARDYQRSAVEARRQIGYSQRDLVRESPVSVSFAVAGVRAKTTLQEIWSGRETLKFSLAPGKLALEPGDVFTFAPEQQQREFRIISVSEGSDRSVTAVSLDKSDYTVAGQVARAGKAKLPALFGAPGFVVMDLPVAGDGINSAASWIAATATPWPGSLSLLEDTGGSFSVLESLAAPAIIAETLSNLTAGPLSRLDKASTLVVRLAAGELASVSQLQMLSGENTAAVGTAQSGWEIIQFQNAELIDEQTYELSVLLRGLAGSRGEMLPMRAAGQTFVLLDDAVRQIPAANDDLARPRTLRLGPAGIDHGSPAYAQFVHAGPGLGLRPYAPVHIHARRNGTGVEFSWIRRTRVDGDSWAVNEVPLGEETESYSLQIMANGLPVRQIDISQPAATYSDVQMQADFGLPLPETLIVRVYQNSAIFGAGAFSETQVNV